MATLPERLKSDTLIKTPATAQCTLLSATVSMPDAKAGAKDDQHADVEATYSYACKMPQALRTLDVSGLMAAYPRIARVELQVAGPSGQSKQVLRRGESMLRWGR